MSDYQLITDFEQTDNNVKAVLPPSMTIETAEQLAQDFQHIPLNGKISLHLSAAKIETISTPGIQLLLSLEKSLSTLGGTLHINEVSDHIHQVFTSIGVGHLTDTTSQKS